MSHSSVKAQSTRKVSCLNCTLIFLSVHLIKEILPVWIDSCFLYQNLFLLFHHHLCRRKQRRPVQKSWPMWVSALCRMQYPSCCGWVSGLQKSLKDALWLLIGFLCKNWLKLLCTNQEFICNRAEFLKHQKIFVKRILLKSMKDLQLRLT